MATAHQITWRERLEAYYYLCRFDKPIGTELVFWPTMWALWIANQGMPSISILIPMILGTIFMRAAGCAINDFADRKVDAHVERTKTRPLATGIISAQEAIYVFLALVAASACMLFFLPIETFYWSFGALFLAFIYPFMKRFTHLPQVFLAAAFGWAIPMAYVAVSQVLTGQTEVDIWCWLLFFGYMCWTVAYDTQYAMADREDDLKIGVKSTAILFGKHDVLIISLLQGVFLLSLAGVFWHYFGALSVLALLPIVAMFYRQNKQCLTYDRKLCFNAFLDNVWVGRYVFLLIVILSVSTLRG